MEIIPEYVNYEVSNLGMLRNAKTKRLKNGKRDINGYKRATLYPYGKTIMVHRLILMAFKPTDLDLQVNHINGIRDDNRLANLEWATAKENSNRRVTKVCLKGENNPMSLLKDSDVLCIRNNYTLDIRDSEIAKKYNVPTNLIMRVRNGTAYTHVKGPTYKNRPTSSKGSKVHTARLTEDQVYNIKFVEVGVSAPALGLKYNVSKHVIHKIRQGTTWKHVTKIL